MKHLVYPFLVVFLFFSCKISKPENSVSGLKYDNSFLKDVKVSIHRGGGFEANWPENSLESFKHYHEILPKAMIECDVRMTKDSILVLMHDESLERTSNGTGLVSKKTYQELKSLCLKDKDGNLTGHKIPTFREVLQWANQTVPLTVDIKRNIPQALIIGEIERLNSFGNCLLTTYNWKEVVAIDSLSKQAMISVSIRSLDDYRKFLNTGISGNRIAAFTGTEKPDEKLLKFLNRRQIPTILGTLGKLDKLAASKNNEPYIIWYKNGIQIFATDRPIEAQLTLNRYIAKQ